MNNASRRFCLYQIVCTIVPQHLDEYSALNFSKELFYHFDLTSNLLQISSLWDMFCFNIPGTTPEQSRAALHILCMAAKSCPGILNSHISDVIDIGFGRWSKVDPLLARTACIALQRLSDEEKKKLLQTSGNRIFGILQSIVTSYSLPDNIWYAAADKVVSAIYSLHPTPEILAAEVVKKCIRSGFDKDVPKDPENETEHSTPSTFNAVKVGNLSRCLFVASHVGMNQLVYIESCIRKIQKQKVKTDKTRADSGSAEEADNVTHKEVQKTIIRTSIIYPKKSCNFHYL